MSSEAQAMLDTILKVVKDRYAVDPTQQAPMVFGFKDGKVEFIMQLDFGNEVTKTMSIAQAAVTLNEHGCDGSVFISEGWVRMAPFADIAGGGFVRPRDAPDRIEVFMAEVSTPERYIHEALRMERGERGTFTGFAPLSRFDSAKPSRDRMQSRFDFFDTGQR